jgi:outer membrane immunogenic protein
MKKIALAAAAASLMFAGAGAASAADMAPRYAKAPPPIVAPIFSWTGFYIGGFVGGATGDRDATSTVPCIAGGAVCYGIAPAAAVVNSYSLDSSFIGGGTVGYNWQAGSFLLGLEGEVGYLKLHRSVVDQNQINGGFGNNAFDTTRIGDWYGVIAGRLGFTVDRLLIYGKGGVAFVDKHYDYTDACTVAPCGPLTLTLGRNTTYTTWAAGGGLEYAFTPNWSIKGEYLYIDTRETITSRGVASDGTVLFNTHTDPGIHTGKIGVNYRFGGPVVARY